MSGPSTDEHTASSISTPASSTRAAPPPRRSPTASASRSPGARPCRSSAASRACSASTAPTPSRRRCPNVLVDHVHEHGGLGRGVGYWLGNAMLQTGRSPQQIAEAVDAGELDLTTLELAEDGAIHERVIDETAARLREIRGALRRAPGDARAPRRSSDAAALRAHRHGRCVRGRRARQGRGRGRRRHRGRDPLDRAEPARLRPLRPHHRGLRRHVRHAGQLPHHARGDGRVVGAARPLHPPVELLLGPVHVGDRRDGRVGGLRQHGQRRPLRDPLPRHQHRPRPDRPARVAHDQRLLRRRHQHRRGQLPAHRRRDRGGAVGDGVAVHQPPARARLRRARRADRARRRVRDRRARHATGCCTSGRRRS